MSFLQETIDIELLQVEMFSIHGSIYYQIRYRTLQSGEIHDMRINPEAFYSDPQEGDHVRVTRLLGNVMGAEKLDHAISPSD